MLKLFISKSKELNEKEIAVLAALNGMYSVRWEQMVTSIDSIGYFITGRFLKTYMQKRKDDFTKYPCWYKISCR